MGIPGEQKASIYLSHFMFVFKPSVLLKPFDVFAWKSSPWTLLGPHRFSTITLFGASPLILIICMLLHLIFINFHEQRSFISSIFLSLAVNVYSFLYSVWQTCLYCMAPPVPTHTLQTQSCILHARLACRIIKHVSINYQTCIKQLSNMYPNISKHISKNCQLQDITYSVCSKTSGMA